MGILAASAPTLRPGWRWLFYKMKGYSSGKGHTLLTDEVHLRPFRYGNGKAEPPMSVAMITSKGSTRNSDLESGHPLPPTLPQIQKTTRVDIDYGDKYPTDLKQQDQGYRI